MLLEQPMGRRAPTPRRTLHLCRSLTEAAIGAVGQADPGFLVSIFGEPGAPIAKTADLTPFGPVVRTHEAPDRQTLESIVLDTLEVGFRDVWLSCNDPDLTRELADRARAVGHAVARPGGSLPDSLPDPYALFARSRDLGGAGADGLVLSFCKFDLPEDREPLTAGATLAMNCKRDDRGGTLVWYDDTAGRFIAPHGTLPRGVGDLEAARLRKVRPAVTQTSLGRGWRDGQVMPYQVLIFRIPADVARLLADAKLEGPWGGRAAG